MTESVPAAALVIGLHPARVDTPPRATAYTTGQCLRWDHPLETAQNRCGYYPQHAQHPVHDVEQLPLPRLVLLGGPPAGAGISQPLPHIHIGLLQFTGG